MNRAIVSIMSVALVAALAWPAWSEAETVQPQGKRDRASYSLGNQIGRDMKREGQAIDPEAFLQGMVDALDRSDPRIGKDEMNAILVELKRSVISRQRAEKLEMADQRLGAGKEFLAANAARKEVIVLPSGLQYRVIREGRGPVPGPTDRVAVKYRGSMIDGTPFHDSTDDAEPERLRVDGVIGGLTEALQIMKEGARWEIFLPPDLAYGQRGLLANRTVIFDLELIAVEPGD